MKLHAHKTSLENILPFRNLFLQETNFQIRYNACHERGWSDSYLLMMDELAIGYGAVKGQEIPDRDTVFEFYVIPPYRKMASILFKIILNTSDAIYIECQSNDHLLSFLLYEFAQNINSNVILFEDEVATEYVIPDITFYKKKKNEVMLGYKPEEMGAYILKKKEEIVATGGFLLHYNMPFADLYMEVPANYRRQGLGSFILQEIKKECYQTGRIPAARCNINNPASKATLLKAGMKVVGYMLIGEVKINK